MNFDVKERALLAALADVLIPADDGFPSASQACVAESGLDQILAVRPELGVELKVILNRFNTEQAPVEMIAELRDNAPAKFAALAELVSGSYFLNPQVREQLAYAGQSARPIDPHPDYLDDGLLQSVLDRGPIYRPTP